MDKATLLKKFFENNCTDTEAAEAMQLLQKEPALLNEYLSKTVWNNIDISTPLHPDLQDELRKRILADTTRKRVLYLRKAIAVAASFIGLFFLASLFFNKTTEPLPQTALKYTRSFSVEKISNNTTDNKKIVLADLSSVTLYPGSQIEYHKQFASNRNIELKGKAVIEVAKNKKSPFTVYSGAIATTALGTVFMVDNRKGLNRLNVQLFEGKIVVKSVDSSLKFKSTILFPGQQCFVNVKNNSFIVEAIIPDEIKKYNIAQAPISPNPKPIILENLTFTQTPLSDVFDKLQTAYGKKIEYDNVDINGNYFTGSFHNSESEDAVLKLITKLNGLQYKVQDQTIIIEKNNKTEDDDADINIIGNENTTTIAGIKDPQKLLGHIKEISIPENPDFFEAENVMSFNKSSLKYVIQKVQEASGYKILYNESDLQGKYFSGQISINNGMIKMLKTICYMNGLKLTKQSKTYSIRKVHSK
ncbi:MAG: FecR domain-containing protein [Niabella sp.]